MDLDERFPELSVDQDFIRERGEYAAQACADTLMAGHCLSR